MSTDTYQLAPDAEHVMPDGRNMVTVSTPYAVEAQLFRAVALGGVDGERLFDVTAAGSAEAMPDLELAGEASYGGYRLLSMTFLVGEGEPDSGLSVMVCQGEKYELSSAYQAGDNQFDRFQTFLDQFDPEEETQGLTLNPDSGSDVTIKTRSLSALIPEVCGLVSYFEPSGAGLPARSGRKVRGGQLWKIQDRGSVVVGNQEVVTEVAPFVQTEQEPSEEDVTPSWTRDTESSEAVVDVAESLSVDLRVR